MRTLLLLLVLAPTVGLVVLATVSAAAARGERQASVRVRDESQELSITVDALAAVADEEVVSSLVTIAYGLGLDLVEVGELQGIDYQTELDEARAAVDASPVLTTSGERAELQVLRERIDDGSAAFVEVTELFQRLSGRVQDRWERGFGRLQAALDAEPLPGALHVRADAADGAYEALVAGQRRATILSRLLVGELPPEQIAAFLDASARFDATLDHVAARLGEQGQAARQEHLDDPASVRFEASLDAAASLIISDPSALEGIDPVQVGAGLADADVWASSLTSIVLGATDDLRAAAADQVAAADTRARIQGITAGILALLSLGGAALLARSLTRPTSRLGAAAHQVHLGRFDLEPLSTDGPRELADTAAAFNEMTATLATVEAHAVAMADDPDAPVLNEELPGRTGRALQVALNRLRASIRLAEQQRRELQLAATHDGLTGLLNRAAAFEMLDRELAHARRDGGFVMALFIDVDGLKAINDDHGHAAGDDALRLVADALRAATRESDIAARIGGDEFLVAGTVADGGHEAQSLAERVRSTVAGQVIRVDGASIELRCSIGVSMAVSGDATSESLIHDADSALYRAKREGRDRVVWYGSQPAE